MYNVVLLSKQYALLEIVKELSVGCAFSLRRLSDRYYGKCIKVRRSTDDAVLDIPFLDNFVCLGTLLSFVGSGSGYIDTWYDQGGLFKDATQSTKSQQPRIVNNGVIESLNGLPTIRFVQSATNSLVTTYAPALGTANIVSAEVSNTIGAMLTGTNVNCFHITNGIYRTGIAWTNYDYTVGTLLNALRIKTFDTSAGVANTTFWANGFQITKGTTQGSSGSTYIRIGGRDSLTNHYDGYISEVIVSPTSIPTNLRQLLEINQGRYYKIFYKEFTRTSEWDDNLTWDDNNTWVDG